MKQVYKGLTRLAENIRFNNQWEYTDITGDKHLGLPFIQMADYIWANYPNNVVNMEKLSDKELKNVAKYLNKKPSQVHNYMIAFVWLDFARWLHIPSLRKQVSGLREYHIAKYMSSQKRK